MTPERQAIVIFEDEAREVDQLRTLLPSEYVILALTTMEACRNFVNNPEFADQQLQGAVLVACIIDGKIDYKSLGGDDGVALITAMKSNERFASVLLISNSGRGKLEGAHAHLEKAYWRKKKYLPLLDQLLQLWLQRNKKPLDLST